MSDDWSAIDRPTVIDALGLLRELVDEKKPKEFALRLIDSLIWRLDVDSAMAEKSAMTEWYGEQMLNQ
jgi:hypothetical protein